MASRTLLLAAAAALLPAEIIDRIVVTINTDVITQSEVREEIRMTAFLNGEQPDFSLPNQRKTAERLVEQSLLRRDMELTRFPQPEPEQAPGLLNQVRAGRSEVQFRNELAGYGLTEAQLREHLLRQAAILRYIDFRFKPDVQLSEFEIRDYYENRLLPELKKRGASPQPSYDEARGQIEEALAAERVDEIVDRWLKEARERTRIGYREEAFR